MDIKDRFAKYDKHYLDFDGVPADQRHSNRPDVHLFVMLDKLFPDNGDIVVAAEHDEIYLDIGEEQLSICTEEQIEQMVRCGARLSYEGLAMFV